MVTTVTIIRGDSYEEDFVSKTTLPSDTGYANWEGTWAIVDKLESAIAPLATGSLTKATDPNLRMQLRISSASTLAVPVGTYKLIVQLTNTATGFSREVAQRTCIIAPKGI